MPGKLRLLQQFVARERLDGFLVTNLTNIRYLTGFTGSNAFLLVLPTGAVLFTDFRYKDQVREETKSCDIRIIKESLSDEVAGSKPLKAMRRGGFESQNMRFVQYEKLKELQPKLELVPFGGVVELLRMKKSKKEIKKIRKAVEIADLVLKEVLPTIKPGVRESEVAAEIEYLFKLNGGESPAFPTIVASGSRSALPHASPGRKKIEKRDLVTIDMGTSYDGYCSDMTRTMVVGRAGSKQKKIYQLVLKAQERAIASLRRGLKLSTLDSKARRLITEAGYGKNFGHGLGHGVGLDVHELPRISSKSGGVIEEGMVFTIEPGVYISGWGGVRIEDVVAVTGETCEVLTRTPKELIEL